MIALAAPAFRNGLGRQTYLAPISNAAVSTAVMVSMAMNIVAGKDMSKILVRRCHQ